MDGGRIPVCRNPTFNLNLTNHSRRFAVSVDRLDSCAAISFCNYGGTRRRSSRKELLGTLNGFAAEIGSLAEYGPFERFRSRVPEGRLEDTAADGQRIMTYSKPGVPLDLCQSLYSGAVKSNTPSWTGNRSEGRFSKQTMRTRHDQWVLSVDQSD